MLTISKICKNQCGLCFSITQTLRMKSSTFNFVQDQKQAGACGNLIISFKYQKKMSLPLAIHKALIPILKDLSNQDLFKKVSLRSNTE